MAKVETTYELVTRIKAELAKNAPYRTGSSVTWMRPDRQILLDLQELVELVNDTLPKEAQKSA